MSKYYIIIIVIAVVLASLMFVFIINRNITPTSFEFVGTITSVQNRFLAMTGLYTALNQTNSGMLVGREITVAILPDTKIYRQTNINGAIKKEAVSFEDLQKELQKGPITLARVRSDSDIYNRLNIIAAELVYTKQTGPGGAL